MNCKCAEIKEPPYGWPAPFSPILPEKKMPEVERPDYVMYEMVIKEAKKTKRPRPNSANILNMEDIQMKLQV